MRRCGSRFLHALTAASSRKNESESSLPGSYRLSKRSTEMKPSMVSSSGRSSAARSRYRCFCPGFGQISKMTAIILNTSLSVPSRSAVRCGEAADWRCAENLKPPRRRRLPYFNRTGGSGHGPQEGALLAQDEALLLCKAEIGGAFTIGLEPRAVGLVGGEAVERNQRIADVVGALMRHPIAEEISAALGNDGEPPPGVFFEGVALKRIELVADEDRDRHGSLPGSPAHPAAFRAEHASDFNELCQLVASHIALVAAPADG